MFNPNDTIGPYTLIQPIGRGSFGEVWLAERRSTFLTMQLALKLPLSTATDLDVIRREADIWRQASGHPNIVPVLDAEMYDGQVVIASEYIAGGSLADLLRQNNGRCSSHNDAARIITAILDGLEYLHKHHLIHRDLKPDNVLLQSGIPRLTDFGLSRALRASAHSSNIVGTPAYMAPEAFQGHCSVESDIWATGVLLYEMLTGTLPFPQSGFYPLLLAITGEDRPQPLPAEIPETLKCVIMRALAKPQHERFQTAAEMKLALEANLQLPQQAALSAPKPSRRSIDLPKQTTSFIGRNQERAQIKDFLGHSQLVTLIGPAGCGKTRLAIYAAQEELDAYPDGIGFVEFDALHDPTLVPQTVTAALHIRQRPGKLATETLISHLAGKKFLLLLDNCEHLIQSIALLANLLLRACPNLHILTTSRESLGIPLESILQVRPLSVPPLSRPPSVLNSLDYESVLKKY